MEMDENSEYKSQASDGVNSFVGSLSVQKDDVDPATGLIRMQPFIAEAGRIMNANHKPGVLLFYNIVNFSRYNYQYGLESGDKLLYRIANILRTIYPDSLIAHFDVDHFVVLTSPDSADSRVEASFHEISRYLPLNTIKCKIGGYMWDDFNVSAELACTCVKIACDSIHGIHNEHFVYYSEDMKQRRELFEYISAHIDEAIEKRWIKTYYQPIIRTVSGQLSSLEALSRWDDPVYGMLMPAQFIVPLESSGQIYKLDVFTVQEICRKLSEVLGKGKKVVPVSFNLTRADFLETDIFREVENAVTKYAVPRRLIRIEVTERVYSENDDIINVTLGHFRNAGYEIWIDDFGSGYSTLNLLKDHDYDLMKIDLAFMRSNTARSRSIIQSIVEMSDNLGGKSLTEGVETKEQFKFLRSIGCDMAQGFYFSKPLPYDELMAEMEQKGITLEESCWSSYYDSINNVSFVNGQPTAFLEYDKNNGSYRYVYVGEKYKQVLNSVSGMSVQQMEDLLNNGENVLQNASNRAVQAAIRSWHVESFHLPSGDQTMKVVYRPLSHCEGKVLFLAEVYNSTDFTNISGMEHEALLRNIFYLYDEIYEVNYGRNFISQAVILNGTGRNTAVFYGIDETFSSYCRKNIHPDDRERYMKFADFTSMMDSVRMKQKHIFRGAFRTMENDGTYAWRVHTVVYTPRGKEPIFLYLTQKVNDSLKEIKAAEKEGRTADQPQM